MSGKTIAFQLSMPGVSSWNGRWTGEGKLYVLLRRVPESRVAVLDGGYWGYDFGDGWRAGVSARLVEGREITNLRKASAGFCGYDWMVDSILEHGRIQTERSHA